MVGLYDINLKVIPIFTGRANTRVQTTFTIGHGTFYAR